MSEKVYISYDPGTKAGPGTGILVFSLDDNECINIIAFKYLDSKKPANVEAEIKKLAKKYNIQESDIKKST